MSCALRVDASDAKEAKRNAAARPTLLYDRLTKNARSVAAQTRGGTSRTESTHYWEEPTNLVRLTL